MPELTPDIVDEVLATCNGGVDEAAEALGRALDAEIGVSVGQPATVDLGALPEDLSGPGLAVVLSVGSVGALLLLPESGGLVPEWCADPDPTGQSKLTTLAQELGMILLPEQFMPDDFKTARVKNLEGALRRGGVADGAGMVPLELSAEDKQGTARLIWPVAKPSAVLGSGTAKPPEEPKPEPKREPKPEPEAKPTATTPAPAPPKKMRQRTKMPDLPAYTRSLLKVRVPVVVTLANKRQPLGRIVELGPGSIIQFEKSCEEMLDMDVGDCHVASGEAVKVGDKFGLRITSMVLPKERFTAVKSKQAVDAS